jgi:hypothetical protein
VDEGLIEEGVRALRAAALEKEGIRQTEILHWLRRLVPTYAPSPTGLGRYDQNFKDRRDSSGSHPVYRPGNKLA